MRPTQFAFSTASRISFIRSLREISTLRFGLPSALVPIQLIRRQQILGHFPHELRICRVRRSSQRRRPAPAREGGQHDDNRRTGTPAITTELASKTKVHGADSTTIRETWQGLLV